MLYCFSFLGFLSQQGYEKFPASASTKVLYISGFVFGMLMFTNFSANIITMLTTPERIRSLDALIDFDAMGFVITNLEVFKEDVEKATGHQVDRLKRKMREGDFSSIHIH